MRTFNGVQMNGIMWKTFACGKLTLFSLPDILENLGVPLDLIEMATHDTCINCSEVMAVNASGETLRDGV